MKNPLPLIAITIITQVSMAQNVGIGVTVPSAKLQILQTGTTPGLRVAIENPASVTPGLFVVSNSQGGPVEAINTATTGVINGVAGVVSSSSAGTITSGVSGVLGISQATSSGALSAGVRGINYSSNTSGVGVVGYHAGAGVGVFGEGGTGVYGFGHGANARGVRGLVSDANAIGILAEYGGAGAGTALLINNGRLGVSGTNRFAFKHQAAVGNTGGNSTIINNALCNNDPNAIVYVVAEYRSPDAEFLLTSPVGVRYDTGNQRWRIFLQSGATLPVGALFNVIVVNQL